MPLVTENLRRRLSAAVSKLPSSLTRVSIVPTNFAEGVSALPSTATIVDSDADESVDLFIVDCDSLDAFDLIAAEQVVAARLVKGGFVIQAVTNRPVLATPTVTVERSIALEANTPAIVTSRRIR